MLAVIIYVFGAGQGFRKTGGPTTLKLLVVKEGLDLSTKKKLQKKLWKGC
jgi:hypothetical protein